MIYDPKVSIISLNYNQISYTLKCISSLLQSKYSNFQIFIVDNGSSNSEKKKLKEKFYNIDLVTILDIHQNVGYVGGINYALKKIIEISNTDYFLIMNNDTIIDSEAIGKLVKTASYYENKCIVSGKVYHYDKPGILQYIGQKFIGKNFLSSIGLGIDEEDKGQYDEIIEMDMIDDIFWLLPLNVFKKVGLYSNYFFLYGEQNDYALRAGKHGFKLIYEYRAKLWHKGSITSASGDRTAPRLVYWRNKGSLTLAYLHLSRKEFLQYYLNYIILLIGKFIKEFFNSALKSPQQSLVIKARFLAWFVFTKWLLIKNEDKGYNPFK